MMTYEYLSSYSWTPRLWYLKTSLIIIVIIAVIILLMIKLKFQKRWLNIVKHLVFSLIILIILGYSALLYTLGRPLRPSKGEIEHTLEKMAYYLAIPKNMHCQVGMSRKDTTYYTTNLKGGNFKMTFVEKWCGCCGTHREIEYQHPADREINNADEAKVYLAELGISSNVINKLERQKDFYIARETFEPGRPEDDGQKPVPVYEWWDGSYELTLKTDGSVLLEINGGYPP